MGAAVSQPAAMAAAGSRIAGHRRIVVKVGSSLLVERGSGRPKQAWLATLAKDLAGLWRSGSQLAVVSSGAIALGRGRLGIAGRLKLEEAQAAAAVGQVGLAHLWSEALGAEGLTAAQILLTLDDTERRRRYLNARATLTTLLGRRVVPIVNENDTVATTEIRYGDNDRLAARVASMIGADCLVLLSDVDGLYSAPPAEDRQARFIPHVPSITPEIEAMAGSAGSDLSRGGMRTKIEAGKIACGSGARMVIADGRRDHPLAAVDAGERATWFDASTSLGSARKAWIMGHMASVGALRIDDGARAALKRGRSLLPAGVAAVEGSFSRGDAVRVLGVDGREVGRGLVGYDASEARMIAGRRSEEIEAVLGHPGRSEMIHRDDLVLTDREETDDA